MQPNDSDPKVATGGDTRFHVDDIVADGWKGFDAVSTLALLEYYGIAEQVLEFEGFFNNTRQAITNLQIEIEEHVLDAGDLKKADLHVMVFNADQTDPAEDAVYNGADDETHICTVTFEEADYERVSNLTWKARKTVQIIATNGDNSSSSLFFAVLAGEALQYAAGTTIRVRPFAQQTC